MAKKKQHGGKRIGAGRKVVSPDGPAVAVTATVPSGLVSQLDAHAEQQGWSRSEAITRAIRALLGEKRR